MANTDHSEDDEVKAFNARLAAATTREEKLAVLREYMDEEYAQFSLDWAMGENLEKYESHRATDGHEDIFVDDLVDAAPTREEKLAVLREYYGEEEAQQELRLIDVQPLVAMAPTQEAKLAILRQHAPEERAQAQLRYLARQESDATPNAPYVGEWGKISLEQLREIQTRSDTAATPEQKLAILREYVSEEGARAMLDLHLRGKESGFGKTRYL